MRGIIKFWAGISGNSPGGALGAWLPVAILAWGLPVICSAQLAEGNERLKLPASQLNKPFENPVFLTGHVAYGGGFQKQAGDLGYGGSLVFRPGSPTNIFDHLFGWNAGMVIQVDYLEMPDGGDITSLDLIWRRYFGNRGDLKTEVNLFLGLGSGVSSIDRPDPADISAGDHWSILAEAGQEWYFKPGLNFMVKGQYRWMINAGRTYRTWSVLAGLGIAWP